MLNDTATTEQYKQNQAQTGSQAEKSVDQLLEGNKEANDECLAIASQAQSVMEEGVGSLEKVGALHVWVATYMYYGVFLQLTNQFTVDICERIESFSYLANKLAEEEQATIKVAININETQDLIIFTANHP